MRKLVVTLGELGLTGQEIAETIWLAQKTVQVDFIDVTAQPVEEDSEPTEQSIDAGQDNEAKPETAADEPRGEIRPAPTERSPSLALPPGYKTISVPDARSLTQPLQLARALRPLARRVAVGMPTILDEAATVDAVAETGLWHPILKPDSELWLDVALVFDTSPSMSLWQRLSKDLHRLLSRYGEFRDVRLWQLKYERDKIQLTSRRGVPHKPKELLTGDRRRLIVVVSDCVAPAWHDGTMQTLLNTWATKLPTVVFHVFPERLWARTALVQSVPVKFKPRRAGMPSNALQPLPRSVWDIERLITTMRQPTVRLPVVSLEVDSLANLANVVAGDRRARVLGIVWSDRSSGSENDLPQVSSTIEDLTNTFVLTASATARELASLLAAAPVITLPVVRLIRNSMLPRASAVHDAEVLMSGLLVVSGDQTPTYEEAEKIAYEIFNNDVRDRLRAGYSKIDALTVLEKVSKHVARRLGISVSDFKALLTSSDSNTTSQETEFLNAFATVTASILRSLGGEFRAIADTFAPPPEDIEVEDETDDWLTGFTHQKLTYTVAEYLDFPPINNFDYTQAELVEDVDTFPPPLKPDDFKIVTIELQLIGPQLEPFDFTVATLVDRQNLPDPTARADSPHDSRPQLLPELPPQVPGVGDFTNQRPEPPSPVPGPPASLRPDDIPRRQLDDDAEWLILRGQQQANRFIETLPDDIPLEMVSIPAGTFLMGSPNDEPERNADRESPQHEATISPFFMGRYPITQEQWRTVANLPQVNRKLKLAPSRFKGDRRPVEQVSWRDAVEFCDRLSAYTDHTYRLPSEAEWEYACRAGTTTPFHFGDMIITDVANYNGRAYANGPAGNRRGETTLVDHFGIANAFGLSDMHGNVFEWCADHWHPNYDGAPADGTAWIEGGNSSFRVRRGGSWVSHPRNCRSAYRLTTSPVNTNVGIGFRVVCSAPRALP
ncbi:MAG: formylglycine-generating enzyme family protein [Cyanobacteria bacterium P01_C01_bin.120]